MSTNPFSDSNDPFGKTPQANPYAAPAPVAGAYSSNQLEEMAKEQLKIPAVILVVLSILSELHRIGDLIFSIYFVNNLGAGAPPAQGMQIQTQMTIAIVGDIAGIVLGIVSLVGAICMLKLNSKVGAWAGAVAAVIPCYGPCLCLGIPFGIWAMVILAKPEVSRAFKK